MAPAGSSARSAGGTDCFRLKTMVSLAKVWEYKAKNGAITEAPGILTLPVAARTRPSAPLKPKVVDQPWIRMDEIPKVMEAMVRRVEREAALRTIARYVRKVRFVKRWRMHKIRDILKNVNWNGVCDVMYSIGDQLNAPTERFDKGGIGENAIATLSNGELTWINGVGKDHWVVKLGRSIESKFERTQSDFGTNGALRRTLKRTIKNKLGKGSDSAVIHNPADWYLFWNSRSAFLVDAATVQAHARRSGDQICAKVPISEMYCVFMTNDTERKVAWGSADYLVRKRRMQQDMINDIAKRYRTTAEAALDGFAPIPTRRPRRSLLRRLFSCLSI